MDISVSQSSKAPSYQVVREVGGEDKLRLRPRAASKLFFHSQQCFCRRELWDFCFPLPTVPSFCEEAFEHPRRFSLQKQQNSLLLLKVIFSWPLSLHASFGKG